MDRLDTYIGHRGTGGVRDVAGNSGSEFLRWRNPQTQEENDRTEYEISLHCGPFPLAARRPPTVTMGCITLDVPRKARKRGGANDNAGQRGRERADTAGMRVLI